MFEHTILGFCLWDIPALIVLLAIIVIFVVHRHKQKKREREFEDMLTKKLADKAATQAAVNQ